MVLVVSAWTRVVHDLDALALHYPEGDDLAALVAVADVHVEVVHEAGVPQPPEILLEPPLVVAVAGLVEM